jgi:putative SOS response-associated peptidase YedK
MAGIHAGSSSGFAVLTQQAASPIRHIHERMPVLLRVADVIPWLEHGEQPHEPPTVEHWPVSMEVNRVGTQGAHLAYPLSTLF